MSFTVSLSNLQVYVVVILLAFILFFIGVVIKLHEYKCICHRAEEELNKYKSLYQETEKKLQYTTKVYEDLRSCKINISDIRLLRDILSQLDQLVNKPVDVDNLLYRSSFCNNVIGDLNYIKDRLYEVPNQPVADYTAEVFKDDDMEEHSIEVIVDDDSTTENFQEVISFLSDFIKAVDEGKLNNFYEEKGITDSIQIRVNTHKYKNLIH